MVKTLNFYMDDSGPRHPDRKPDRKAAHGRDWFAFGGILINDEDEPRARALHADFMKRWSIASPLHSSEIRSRNRKFLWLQELWTKDKKSFDRFHEELNGLMREAPVIGLACVIDRPGYDARYKEKYAGHRWMLCKTAFAVAVERAAKFARRDDRKLRVFPERCNKPENAMVRGYYDDLKSAGMPFSPTTSDKYGPLTPAEFAETLYEFDLKSKSSPMAQMADLILWPICMGGYHRSNRPYARLLEDGKLIEAHIAEEAWPLLATKYSCFDDVEVRP
ncbi:MAG TPA: DUF3800 domain-containing protein [Alphaproteobacteria bacterium]|nr:DUF3800 domain-containing protein [Alphaproteobacteria bacterium]